MIYGVGGLDFRVPSGAELDGSTSRPKVAAQSAMMVRVQTMKNSELASKRKESLIIKPSSGARLIRAGLAPSNWRQTCMRVLLFRGRRWRLIHALLHPALMLGFYLLQLRLLVGCKQLVEFVVNARLRDRQLGLNLRFLCS